ncbi:MAG: tol-pal system protein YbgF [Acidobacteria bacterium]|nr:tol-pal system protein YbgF [Acidobacteriota bacterium]
MRERLPTWRVGWTLGIVLTTAGCATTQVPDLTQDVASLNSRVAKLQKDVEESLGAAHPSSQGAQAGVPGTDLAALDARIAALEKQISALRQRLDDSAARVDSLSQDLQATRELAMRMQPARVAPTQPPPGDGEEPPSEASTTGLEDRPDGSATVEDTFSAAYADYAKGNFALALAGFQEFLKKYPNSELADNAQYWIADSYYAQGDFESAAAQFDEVVQKYPKGDRVPAALLKRALCLIELNRTADGVVLLQHLIQTYPSSEEASLAKQRLEAMGVKP